MMYDGGKFNCNTLQCSVGMASLLLRVLSTHLINYPLGVAKGNSLCYQLSIKDLFRIKFINLVASLVKFLHNSTAILLYTILFSGLYGVTIFSCIFCYSS